MQETNSVTVTDECSLESKTRVVKKDSKVVLTELSVMMAMFYICAIQYSIHLSHMAIEHLRCG